LSEHGYVIIETQKIVFGYLSFNLARFTTMFGYFRWQKSGNSGRYVRNYDGSRTTV